MEKKTIEYLNHAGLILIEPFGWNNSRYCLNICDDKFSKFIIDRLTPLLKNS